MDCTMLEKGRMVYAVSMMEGGCPDCMHYVQEGAFDGFDRLGNARLVYTACGTGSTVMYVKEDEVFPSPGACAEGFARNNRGGVISSGIYYNARSQVRMDSGILAVDEFRRSLGMAV